LIWVSGCAAPCLDPDGSAASAALSWSQSSLAALLRVRRLVGVGRCVRVDLVGRHRVLARGRLVLAGPVLELDRLQALALRTRSLLL
jgi:hypothetical protein